MCIYANQLVSEFQFETAAENDACRIATITVVGWYYYIMSWSFVQANGRDGRRISKLYKRTDKAIPDNNNNNTYYLVVIYA